VSKPFKPRRQTVELRPSRIRRDPVKLDNSARLAERQEAKLGTLCARLEVLSPQRTLERGYAALLDGETGRAIRSPTAVKPARRYTVHLAQGAADVSFADVQPRLTDGF